MASLMIEFLQKNGVDAKTASKVSADIESLMGRNPQKTVLLAQLIAAALGARASTGKSMTGFAPTTTNYEGWPCKWYLPGESLSPGTVRNIAQTLART